MMTSTSLHSPKQSEIHSAWQVIRARQTEAPVNVLAIANDFGIKVFRAKLSPSVSGVLRRDDLGGESGYLILVRESDPPRRQRFTIAHELGHFVLHRASADRPGGIEDDEFYRALSGPLEREANDFAAEVLMPMNLVRQLQQAGHVALDDLATRLGVSRQALAIRMGLPYDESWN